MSGIKECCQQEENLRVEPSDNSDTTIRRCQVCQCRHISIDVESGNFNLRSPTEMVNNR